MYQVGEHDYPFLKALFLKWIGVTNVTKMVVTLMPWNFFIYLYLITQNHHLLRESDSQIPSFLFIFSHQVHLLPSPSMDSYGTNGLNPRSQNRESFVLSLTHGKISPRYPCGSIVVIQIIRKKGKNFGKVFYGYKYFMVRLLLSSSMSFVKVLIVIC